MLRGGFSERAPTALRPQMNAEPLRSAHAIYAALGHMVRTTPYWGSGLPLSGLSGPGLAASGPAM